MLFYEIYENFHHMKNYPLYGTPGSGPPSASYLFLAHYSISSYTDGPCGTKFVNDDMGCEGELSFTHYM